METRRFGLADTVFLLVVLAAGAAARAGYLNSCCHQAADAGPYPVQDEWGPDRDALVANLKAGRGFIGWAPLAPREEVTAHTSIGYPWLLSLLDESWLNVPADQLVRWIQCALGTLTAGLYFLFARRAFHSLVVASLAGVLTALYPYWVFNAAEVNDGTLVTFLLALSLFLGVRGGQVGGALTSLVYGLALAGLACVRAPLLPFAFAAALWFLFRCRTLPRGWLYAVLAFLGFVNGLIPWTARNYQTFHTIIPLVDSAYFHLWMGNNPAATGGPLTEQEVKAALGPERTAELEGIAAQPERYRRLAPDVADEIRANPAATFQRRLRAGLGFFFGTTWLTGFPQERAFVRESGAGLEVVPEWLSGLVPALLPGSLLGILVLGALGWRWSYGWRHEAMPAALAVMWIPLPYLLSHAEAFHGPRLPLDGVLLCYAALALVCLMPRLGRTLLRGEEVERVT